MMIAPTPFEYLTWALRLSLALVFLAAGAAKLASVPMMVQIFDQIGFGQWFRIVTGLVEIVGALALLLPGWTALGALCLAATMFFAVLTHIFLLRSSAAAAVVLFALNMSLAWICRQQLLSTP